VLGGHGGVSLFDGEIIGGEVGWIIPLELASLFGWDEQ
jgi:hypothetical protein